LAQKLVKVIGKNLVAHLVGAHGTPVEKHCPRHSLPYSPPPVKNIKKLKVKVT